MSAILTLDQTPSGKKVKIINIQAPGRWSQRLLQMGFVPGNIIEVVVNNGFGPILVRVMGATISLGRGIARRIFVEIVNSQ